MTELSSHDSPSIYVLVRPELSSFNASFTLARQLRARGYRIVYAGPSDWADYISSQSFEYKSFDIPPYSPVEMSRIFKRLPAFATDWLERRRRLQYFDHATETVLSKAEELLRSERPVLILLHPMILLESLPALRSGIPILTFRTNLASTWTLAVPPVFTGIVAEDEPTLRSYLVYAKEWWRILRWSWSWRFKTDKIFRLAHALAPRRSAATLAKKEGFKVRWGEFGPCLTVPELVAAPREIDCKGSANAQKRIYVGSCIDLSRFEPPFDWTRLDKEAPLLYCSLGSLSKGYPHSRTLFSAVINALKMRENLQGIIQIGDVADIEDIGELPHRIRIVHKAPQLEILKHADFFITHGGFSSVREAIYFGVKMIVFPCFWDQPGNAARVRYHRLGISADIANVDPPTILSLLDKLEDRTYLAGISEMQKVFHAQEACEEGIAYIEAFLKEKAPSTGVVFPL